jgi:hypothetical protein
MRILKSKKFWGGAVVGAIFGGWALRTAANATGVNLSLPTFKAGS